MGSVFKEFKKKIGPNPTDLESTNVFAVAGVVARVRDDSITIKYDTYDANQKKMVTNTQEVMMTDLGGTDAYKKGDKVAVMAEKDSDGMLIGKKIGKDNAFLTYKGYGVEMGEAYYREGYAKTGKNKHYLSVSVRNHDAEHDIDITNWGRATDFGRPKDKDGNEKWSSYDKAIRSLNAALIDAGIPVVAREGNSIAAQGIPFDSVLTFRSTARDKDGNEYDLGDFDKAVREGKEFNNKKQYQRSLFIDMPKATEIGSVMTDLYKERQDKKAIYEEHKVNPELYVGIAPLAKVDKDNGFEASSEEEANEVEDGFETEEPSYND